MKGGMFLPTVQESPLLCYVYFFLPNIRAMNYTALGDKSVKKIMAALCVCVYL